MELILGILFGILIYQLGYSVGKRIGFAEGKHLYEPHPEWKIPPEFKIEAHLTDKFGQTHVVKMP